MLPGKIGGFLVFEHLIDVGAEKCGTGSGTIWISAMAWFSSFERGLMFGCCHHRLADLWRAPGAAQNVNKKLTNPASSAFIEEKRLIN